MPACVAVLTFVVFLPTLTNGFVTWDDDLNFLENPAYRGLGWAQLRWMWTTFHLGHYVPLSWMTLGFDYEVWGMNPAGYHLTNLVLHTASAVVIYFVARRLIVLAQPTAAATRPRSVSLAAAVAALFYAIHPLRVESVAWVTERRDVLSGLFYALTVLAYLRACDAGPRARRWYWLAVGAFVCALLSKATAVTLPATLAILNVYPLRRVGGAAGWWTSASRRVYAELLPFALLALGTIPLALVALSPGAQLSIGAKVAVSAYSLAFYLWKTILPLSLSPFYAMPLRVDPAAAVFIVSYVVTITLAVVAVVARRRWPGGAVALLLFFVITLPLLGIVQNGPQIAADRYTYQAGPALAVLVGGAWLWLEERFSAAGARTGALIVFLTFGALTWRQTKVWHDSDTFWSYVRQTSGESAIAETALGNLVLNEDRPADALPHFARAVQLDSSYVAGRDGYGIALTRVGRVEEGIAQFRIALATKPFQYKTHNNLGAALSSQGRSAEAIDEFREALEIKRDYDAAHVNWGNALARLGRLDDAVEHYREALRIEPMNASAQLNWGVVLAREGAYADAVAHFREALRIDPTSADARDYLAQVTPLAK